MKPVFAGQRLMTPRAPRSALRPDDAPPPILKPQMAADYEVDADYVVYRLEEAGATLLALPGSGWSTQLRSSSLDIVRTALESYGWSEARVRPSVPSAEKITRMDEAMNWIPLIPVDRHVLRRVVGRAAWCIRSRTGTCFPGAAWGRRWVRTTRRSSAGMRRGSR